MKNKLLKIVVDVILSFMFFIVAAILINWIAGLLFGVDARGNANLNNSFLLGLTVAVTLGFSVWFYKYVHLGKKSEIE